MRNILWIFGVYEQSGYARNSKDFIKSLNLHGLNVRFNNNGLSNYPEKEEIKQYEASKDFKPDICIYNLVPPAFQPIQNSAPNILMTFAETDSVPKEWVPMCNKADILLTQSYFSKAAFMFSGVTKPVRVAHTPVDVQKIQKTVATAEQYYKIEKGSDFIFFANSEWTPRKGWDILIEAFYRTFKRYEFAHLLIKTCSMGGVENTESITKVIASTKQRHGNPVCKVTLINDLTDIKNVWALYKLADCFVLPSRGEAGGIPYMEAMSLGIPVICPCKGGQIDYINPFIATTINAKYGQAYRMPHNPYYNETMKWVETSADDLGDKMMNITANYEVDNFKKGQKIFEDTFGFQGKMIKETATFLKEMSL